MTKRPMTTNQMVKLFAKILKDAPPVQLTEKETANIRDICECVRRAK